MDMRFGTLASGSSGNSLYAESAEGALLVDAGLSARTLLHNLELAGGDPSRIKGVIVTHDHIDHVRGAGALHRRFGWTLWMTAGTRQAAAAALGNVRTETIRAGSGLSAAGFGVEFVATPHDGPEPVAIVLERGGLRCGVLTDLGHVFPDLPAVAESLDFAFLESNYDPGMLDANRGYPERVKARIRGKRGHLANAEAAEMAGSLSGNRLKWIVLSHLSEQNNLPSLALSCFKSRLTGKIADSGLRIGVAPRHDPMRLVEA